MLQWGTKSLVAPFQEMRKLSPVVSVSACTTLPWTKQSVLHQGGAGVMRHGRKPTGHHVQYDPTGTWHGQVPKKNF